MSSIEEVAGKYKGLRFNCIAESLGELVSQAEANELSALGQKFGDVFSSC